ncbi:MAG TPA: hypothetical protein VFU16_01035 [Solirubrobacterales bacterium]|nr:hypothetical protein [Solirubrobacterales bacterium]
MGQTAARAAATTLAAAFLMALLVYAPVAQAASLPLGSGTTRVLFTSAFRDALRRDGIFVKSLGPAAVKGRQLTLPVTSGSYDRWAEEAVFAHGGGFKLVGPDGAVAVRKLRLDPEAKSLSAVVAGRRIRFAALVGAELEREGFDARLEVRSLRLTGAGAGALNRVFGPRMFRSGRLLGLAETLAETSELEPGFGKFSLGGPDTTFSRLRSMGVEMGLWGSSEAWGEGAEKSFLFPIEPARIASDLSAGVIDGGQRSGVTMQKYESSPREMLLLHPRIDLATRALDATLSPLSTEGAVTGTIATLDFGTARIQFRARIGALEVMGVRAVSTQFMADQLNERLSAPGTFQAGETLALMSINLSAA